MKKYYALGFALAVLSTANGQSLPDKIEKTWLERQSNIRTAVVDLRVEAIYPKGCISKQLARPNSNNSIVLPGTDVRDDSAARVVIDSDKVRLEDHGLHWTRDSYRKSQHVYVISKNSKQMLLENPAGNSTYSKYESREADYMAARDPLFFPIIGYCRGVRSDEYKLSWFTPGDFQDSGAGQVLNRINCLQYRLLNDASTKFLIQDRPERVLVRMTSGIEGFMSTQVTIRYREDKALSLVPEAWEIKDIFPGGQLGRRVQVVVSSIKINEVIPAGEFEITPPKKTNVTVRGSEGSGSRPIIMHYIDSNGDVFDRRTGKLAGNSETWMYFLCASLAMAVVVVLLKAIRKRQ